jgi:hypothetical protein
MRANDVTPERLRALAGRRPDHGRVLSLFVDLDPSRFATPAARDSEITSVLADAHRRAESQELDHASRVAVRADLDRLREQLHGASLPADGAEGLALYASGPADLLEVLRLPRPVPTRSYVDDAPHVAPIADLARPPEPRLAVLVSRGAARFLYGRPEALEEAGDERIRRDEFDREDPAEVERHVREVAARVDHALAEGRWQHLIVGRPKGEQPALEPLLGDQARRRLAGSFHCDVEDVSADGVIEHATELAGKLEHDRLQALLQRLAAGLAKGRATQGFEDTRLMLVERRVEALLLGPDVEAEAEARMALEQDATVHRTDAVEIAAVLRF